MIVKKQLPASKAWRISVWLLTPYSKANSYSAIAQNNLCVRKNYPKTAKCVLQNIDTQSLIIAHLVYLASWIEISSFKLTLYSVGGSSPKTFGHPNIISSRYCVSINLHDLFRYSFERKVLFMAYNLYPLLKSYILV